MCVLAEIVRVKATIVNDSSWRTTMRPCSFHRGVPMWGTTLGVGVSLLCDRVDRDSLCVS